MPVVCLADWVLTPQQPPKPFHKVLFDDRLGTIIAVEPMTSDEITTWQAERGQTRAEGMVVLTPGLINAHAHTELYNDEPFPLEPDQTMADWLMQVMAHRQLDSPDFEAILQEAVRQSVTVMMKTGTTCINDISTRGLSFPVFEQLGVRGVISPEFFHPKPVMNGDLSDLIPKQFIEIMTTLAHQWSAHPRVKLGVSPHAPYNVSPSAWQSVMQSLSSLDIWLIHSHIAETLHEVLWVMGQENALNAVHERFMGGTVAPETAAESPLDYVNSVLKSRTVLAHGVFLNPDDMDAMAQKDVRIVHCPRSNLWLNIHMPPPRTLALNAAIANGVKVGLGTDSALSCPSLDMRDEARIAQHLHGLSAQAAFELVTLGSAQAMFWEEHIGRLETGYQADIVLWHLPSDVMPQPQADMSHELDEAIQMSLYATWLSPKTQCHQVWIAGQHLYTR